MKELIEYIKRKKDELEEKITKCELHRDKIDITYGEIICYNKILNKIKEMSEDIILSFEKEEKEKE